MSPFFQSLKVLDLSRFIAGPHCGMILGDLGADVVKIEKSRVGDESRSLPPFHNGESLYAMALNRNKRSLTLNFRHPRAQEILRELAASADVLIENFRPGTMEKMGCGWPELSAANPRLIMTRVSGFGQDGPYALRPGFDGIAQAMSGLMSITGAADGPPTLAGTFYVDYATALYATTATLAALLAREQSGRGQVVDVSLLDSAVSMLMTAIPEQAQMNATMTRRGNRDRYSAPANTFLAGDGNWILLLSGTDGLFRRLSKAMDMESLAADPRFSTHQKRVENVEAIEAVVQQWMGERTTDEILARMDEAAIPCTKVAGLRDVLANPQLRHRRQIVDVDHPTAGPITLHGVTMRLSETPLEVSKPPPSLGEHCAEVLGQWLGYGEDEVRRLAAEGVI